MVILSGVIVYDEGKEPTREEVQRKIRKIIELIESGKKEKAFVSMSVLFRVAQGISTAHILLLDLLEEIRDLYEVFWSHGMDKYFKLDNSQIGLFDRVVKKSIKMMEEGKCDEVQIVLRWLSYISPVQLILSDSIDKLFEVVEAWNRYCVDQSI